MSYWVYLTKAARIIWGAGKYFGAAFGGYEVGVQMAGKDEGQVVRAQQLPLIPAQQQEKSGEHQMMIIMLAMVVALLFIIFVAIVGNKVCSSVVSKAVNKYRKNIDT